NPPHDAVELAGLVQLLDVVLTFEVVAVQLANEELSALIPAHARRLANEWLARHQLQAKPVRQLECLFAVLRRERFRGVGRLGDLSVGGYGNRGEEQPGK